MLGPKDSSIARVAWLAGVVLAVTWSGCAPYGTSMDRVLGRLARGDPNAALAQLEKKPREQDALYQLERGLLLRLNGRLPESSAAFETAHAIAEDLYTKSVTREAAALAVSDRVRPYRPPTHELLLARQYEARNYLDEGDIEGAAVEARRIGLIAEEVAAGVIAAPAGGDLLARLTAALIFEAAGETDDALVIYRNLIRGRGGPGAEEVLPLPDWTVSRTRLLAAQLGVDLSGDPLPEGSADPSSEETRFTAVVFVEDGFVPPRGETAISVPILKTEREKDQGWVGEVVGERAVLLSRHEWDAPESIEIAYWLQIALPEYAPDPYQPFSCHLVSGGRRADGETVADLGSSVRAALEKEMPGIALRTALRALIKYSAHHEAEKQGGEALGFLVNLLGAATESAETRTWLSLPHQIDLAILNLPEPVDEVALTIGEGTGRERTLRVSLVRQPGSLFGFGSYRGWQ